MGSSSFAFRRLTAIALVVTLAVIAWGAFVRATGSGAGCGAHWPVCNGVVIPRAPSTATLIEYVHRLTSGVALLLALAVYLVGRGTYPRGHRARRAGGFVLLFMLTEAAVGALLVLQQWVAKDVSAARAGAVSVHLFNTFLLLGALALAHQAAVEPSASRPVASPWPRGTFFALTAGWLIVGASGAIAALGDTLFPAASLAAGLAQDLSPTAHFLVRLRVIHPLLAGAIGLLAAGFATSLLARGSLESAARHRAVALGVLVVAQVLLGAANLVLLAPVPLQLAHLLVGDALWIVWVQLGGALWAGRAVESPASASSALREVHP